MRLPVDLTVARFDALRVLRCRGGLLGAHCGNVISKFWRQREPLSGLPYGRPEMLELLVPLSLQPMPARLGSEYLVVWDVGQASDQARRSADLHAVAEAEVIDHFSIGSAFLGVVLHECPPVAAGGAVAAALEASYVATVEVDAEAELAALGANAARESDWLISPVQRWAGHLGRVLLAAQVLC